MWTRLENSSEGKRAKWPLISRRLSLWTAKLSAFLLSAKLAESNSETVRPIYVSGLPERGLGPVKNPQTGTQEAKMVSKISSPDSGGVRPNSESSTMGSSAITNFHLSQDGKRQDDTHGMI